MKCPTCKRAVRKKNPAAETPEEAHKRVVAQAARRIASGLRRPMPKETRYRQGDHS